MSKREIEISTEKIDEMADYFRCVLVFYFCAFLLLSFLLMSVLYVSTFNFAASSRFIYVIYRLFCATTVIDALLMLRVLMGLVELGIVSLNKFSVIKSRRKMIFCNKSMKNVELKQGEYLIYARVGINKYLIDISKLPA